jgi:cytochrome c2
MSDAVPRGLVLALSSAAGLMMFLAAVAAENDRKIVGGRAAFDRYCQNCHSLAAGDNRLGPSLHQVIGRTAGSARAYRYSKAMQKADFTWSESSLEQYMRNPHKFLPGGAKPATVVIPSAEERKKIIVYLQSGRQQVSRSY